MRRAKLFAYAFAAFTTVLAAPSAARAEGDDCPIGKDGVGLGFVAPGPGCATTIHTDASLAALTEDFAEFVPRGTVEVGVMGSLPDADALHFGAVLALSGTDIGGDASGFDAGLRFRGRYWVEDLSRILVLETALGPALSVDGGTHPRVGAYGELGANLAGVLGVFAAIEPTVSIADRTVSTRYALGVKTTAVGFLLVLAFYACAQTGC